MHDEKKEDEIRRTEEAMAKILEVCKLMGWSIAMGSDLEDDDAVRGLLIGEAAYLESLAEYIEEEYPMTIHLPVLNSQ